MLSALRRAIAQCIVRYLQGRAAAKIREIDGGSLYQELLTYTAATKSTGCQWTDYWLLYRSIRKYRPREVLECGTGVSTLVIARALQDNGFGRVTSMEEGEDWFKMAQGLLPDRYKSVVHLRLSATVIDGHAMFRGVRYRDVPERLYDFVFVDGPEAAEGLLQTTSCDFDFINVLRRSSAPVRGIVDSRTNTFWVLARILGHHRVRFSYLMRHGIILPSTVSNIRSTPRSRTMIFAPTAIADHPCSSTCASSYEQRAALRAEPHATMRTLPT